MIRYITDMQHHKVHRDTCELAPKELNKQINIGCHCGDRYVLIAAKKLYRNIEHCSKCMTLLSN